MEEIILWGTGQIANTLIPLIKEEIILVVDNDEKKWGTKWHGHIISKPDTLKEFQGRFHRIIIAANNWEIIRKQIVEEFQIDEKLIDNMYYHQKERLIEKYEKTEEPVIKQYISYLKQRPLDVFNDDFTAKYLDMNIEVCLDKKNSLYYVYHNGKRMYLSKKFSSEEQVREYYRFLCMEQDILSPHRYQTDTFHVCRGDVVLDAGVAEGNFALDIIDIVDRIYFVESDKDWIDALKCTFAPYMDKVELIEGFVGNDGLEEITIDSIIGVNKIDFIKMDIEGAEVKALMGARQTLSKNNVKVDVCAYHNVNDELEIKKILGQIGYKTEVSQGYMIFISDKIYEKEGFDLSFVRGLVRGIRSNDDDHDKKNSPAVVVWGAGKNCKIVMEAIRKDKCNFIGIVDSDERLYQKKYMDKWPIGNPEKVINKTIDYIIISMQSCGTVLKHCKDLGISEDRIINYWKSDDEYDFIDSNVKKICELEKEIGKLRARLSNMPYELGIRPVPIIQSAEKLLEILINEKKSLSRYGDGELEIMKNRERPWFQKVDEKLTERLREVFYCEDEQIIVALANDFGNLDCYTEDAADGIRQYLEQGVRESIMKLIDINRKYYDAYVTRPYLIYKDKSYATRIFALFKKLWKNRDVLLVEGRYAYTGVRNDLFESAASIRRIIAPATNAFSLYDDIFTTVMKYAQQDTLVLISLGPAATVLAYDLSVKGIQAIDIGQLDNEYEWYMRGVDERVEIPGKCVAEIVDCRKPSEIADDIYEREIVAKVL